MPHSGQYSLPTRAIIVALRHEGYGWTYISTKLSNVSPNGCQTFWQRVIARARSQSDAELPPLPFLLTLIEDPHERGREERFPEGSAVQQALTHTARRDEYHEDMPWSKIIRIAEQQEGIRIPYETGWKVLKASEVTQISPRKIELDDSHRHMRIIFSEWALGKLQLGVIFIFTDEMSIESDHHRKRKRVSCLVGENPFDHSRPPSNTFHAVMVWGAICEGYGPGPFHIWWRETEAERKEISHLLNEENKENQAVVNEQIRQAQMPGTREHHYLQEINANVRQRDVNSPLPSGYPRRLRRPQWEFKIEKAERDKKSKGGVDWARYREIILKPLLYPWADEIARKSGRPVYIVEDNASPHVKAKRFAVKERSKYEGRVYVVDWPPLSPDLNKIERCWDSIKNTFDELCQASNPTSSSTQNIPEQVIKRRAHQARYSPPQPKVNSECRDFRKKLLKCLENSGNNNFYG